MRTPITFLILFVLILSLPYSTIAQRDEYKRVETGSSLLIGSDGFDYLIESAHSTNGDTILTGSFSYPIVNVPGSGPGSLYDGPFYDRDEDFREYPVVGDGNNYHYSGQDEIPLTLINNQSEMVFSKYFGGVGSDKGNDVIIDDQGYFIVGGETESNQFHDGTQLNNSGYLDVLVMRIHPNGTLDTVLTFGGTGYDRVHKLALLSDGALIVVGTTSSLDFETKNAFDSTIENDLNSTDIFVRKYLRNGTMEFSTFLGGLQWEKANGLVVDEQDNIYVTGYTLSDDFPTFNAPESAMIGSTDGFLASFDANGSIIKSTYMGGIQSDVINDITLTPGNNLIIVGSTRSENFPVSHGKNGIDTTFNVYEDDEILSDGFFSVLDRNFSIITSSYLGGSSSDSIQGVKTDSQGNIYMVGRTKSANYPIHGNFTRPPPFNSEFLDVAEDGLRQSDMVLTKTDPNGIIGYSVFYGSVGYDSATDLYITETSNGTIVTVNGYTQFDDIPTTEPIFGGAKLDNSFLIQFNVPDEVYTAVEYPGKDRTTLIIFGSVSGVLLLIVATVYFIQMRKEKNKTQKSHHEYREKYDLLKEVMKED